MIPFYIPSQSITRKRDVSTWSPFDQDGPEETYLSRSSLTPLRRPPRPKQAASAYTPRDLPHATQDQRRIRAPMNAFREPWRTHTSSLRAKRPSRPCIRGTPLASLLPPPRLLPTRLRSRTLRPCWRRDRALPSRRCTSMHQSRRRTTAGA